MNPARCVGFAVSIALARGALFAQQGVGALPPEIRAALEHNAAQLGPVTVEVLQVFELPGSREEAGARINLRPPSTPEFYFADRVHRWSWQGGMLYSKTTYPGWRTSSTEASFDGRILYLGRPDTELPDGQRQPGLLKSNPTRLDANNPYIRTEYFEAAGYQLPARGGEMGRVRDAHSRVIGAMREGGTLIRVGDAELDGVAVTRLDIAYPNPARKVAEETDLEALEAELRNGFNTEEHVQRELAWIRRNREAPERRLYSFYLDPALHYAVRQIDDRYEDGRLFTRIVNGDFEELDGRGVWLPRYTRTDYHSWPSITEVGTPEPLFSRVFTRKVADGAAIEEGRFSLAYTEPGALIADDTLAEDQVMVEVPEGVKNQNRDAGTRPGDAEPAADDLKGSEDAKGDQARSGLEGAEAGKAGSSEGANIPANQRGAGGRSLGIVWWVLGGLVLVGLVVWRVMRR
jgi:hypothetical protein